MCPNNRCLLVCVGDPVCKCTRENVDVYFMFLGFRFQFWRKSVIVFANQIRVKYAKLLVSPTPHPRFLQWMRKMIPLGRCIENESYFWRAMNVRYLLFTILFFCLCVHLESFESLYLFIFFLLQKSSHKFLVALTPIIMPTCCQTKSEW